MKRSNFIYIFAALSPIAIFAKTANSRSLPTNFFYDITSFGADPSGLKDSSKALIEMLRAFRENAKPMVFPAGKFVFKDPNASIELLYTTRTAGVHLRGAGLDRTTLVFNAPNQSAIRLVNEGNSQFTWGNYIGHLTIDGNNAVNSRGIEMIGQFMTTIEHVHITKFGSDAIWIPDRSTLNQRWYRNSTNIEDTSSDKWSNAFFSMECCFIDNNAGWAIRNDAGSAWSKVDIRNTAIISNKSGGIYKPGPNFNFILGSIAYNGGPGVVIGRSLKYTSFGILFDRVEFDRNKGTHVIINSAKDTTFNGCRFIHSEDPAKDFSMYPSKSVEINANSTNYKHDVVQNIKFINPKIRWNSTHKKSITIFDFSKSPNINLIDIERLELNTSISSDSPVTLVSNIHPKLTHQRMAVNQTMSDHHIFYANPIHPLNSQL